MSSSSKSDKNSINDIASAISPDRSESPSTLPDVKNLTQEQQAQIHQAIQVMKRQNLTSQREETAKDTMTNIANNHSQISINCTNSDTWTKSMQLQQQHHHKVKSANPINATQQIQNIATTTNVNTNNSSSSNNATQQIRRYHWIDYKKSIAEIGIPEYNEYFCSKTRISDDIYKIENVYYEIIDHLPKNQRIKKIQRMPNPQKIKPKLYILALIILALK